MPKSQNRYIGKENPAKSKYSPQRTMGNNFGRSNQPIIRIKRKECHNGCSRLIFKNDLAIPGINWDNLPRHGEDLQGWDLQTTQHPQEGNLRLRPAICLIVYEGTLLPTSNRREPIYCLSPRDRWPNWKNQCVGRTIFIHIYKSLAIRLGQMAINCRVCTQSNFLLCDHFLTLPSKLQTATSIWIHTERQGKKPGGKWICWRNEVHSTNRKVHH